MAIQLPEHNSLSSVEASRYARQALNSILREYPNAPGQVINSIDELLSPKTLHPAFYGCFDWHSSVHTHWLLVKLLSLFPSLPEGKEIRQALNLTLTSNNILVESAYFGQANHQSFERMYGWGWVLKLQAELFKFDDPDGKIWSQNLMPLTQTIIKLFKDFLPKLTYPIRVGTHTNTAFSLSLALDFVQDYEDQELENLIKERCITYFIKDKDFSAQWEPGGGDFLSPALTEADLMSRIIPHTEFNQWFIEFLPGLVDGSLRNLLNPVVITDHRDPSIGHLNGLQLSRAWSMLRIARALPDNSTSKTELFRSANLHRQAGMSNVITSEYMGGHWLASFALYLITVEMSEQSSS